MSPKASKLPDSIEGALRRRKAPPEFVACFARSVNEAKRGPGHIRESEIEPVTGIAPLPEERLASARDLARTVAITLNGGLGTTMGMRGPKSLLTASGSLTFLEVALRQAEMVGVRPLLMNSFATDRAVQEALASREGDHGPVASFLQHEAPKLRAADFGPVSIPGRPELEWCPPGHGDVFTALLSSGWLERLLAEGFCYAFLSNVDNVGGRPDPALLARFLRSGAPFLMEVVRRRPDDWKGGHLARRRSDGRLVLRETAQCHPEDTRFFEDHERHVFFNANNLWLRLETLASELERRGGFLPLPVIVNPKSADPRDPDSTPVLQLEQAAGTAVEIFEEALAVEVPRHRFAPVKTTENLLALRSDIYRVGDDGAILPERDPPPVRLDPEHYRFVSDLEARFPEGPPSLVACERFEVKGDVRFGGNVRCEGEVRVLGASEHQASIPDGARLRGVIRVG